MMKFKFYGLLAVMVAALACAVSPAMATDDDEAVIGEAEQTETLPLPEAAAEEGVEASEYGRDTAAEARERGREFGQDRASEARERGRGAGEGAPKGPGRQ